MSLLSQLSIHAWINENQIKNEKGDPIEFRNHLFLFDVYRDRTDNLVVMKAAQVGASTMDVLKTIYDAKRDKMDIIYTLPTFADVQVFVGGKVNRIIAQNPILQSYTKDKDTIEQKMIGNSMIYFRGTFSAKAAIMVTADRVIHDEIDSSNQEVAKFYQSRLQHSKFKQTHVFSHPSVPGFGVDVEWQKSDQKHWFVKCPHCHKENFLSWPESVCSERKKYICKDCHEILPDEARRTGRWVKRFKDRKWSGYWISLLMAPWTTAEEVLEKYNDTKIPKDFFYNKVLGLPYVGGGNKVTQDMIFRNLTNKPNLQEGRIVIGVDTGIRIHYVIGNKQGLFNYGSCDDYDTLDRFLKRWPRAIMIIDQGGDLIGSRKLREKYIGRVFLCHYSPDRKTYQLTRWGDKDELGNVRVDRNRIIQLVVDEFKDKRIPLCGVENDWYDFWLHWKNLYRVGEEDHLGVKRYKWKRSGADHFCHCLSGNTKIAIVNGERAIKDIRIGDTVITSKGVESVYKSWLTRENAKVITAYFSNGSKLVATPSHKIKTNRGFIPLDSISYSDRIEVWKRKVKQLYSMASSFVGIPMRGEGVIGYITRQMGLIVKMVLEGCIKRFGNSILGKFLWGLLSIIKTIILSIMRLTILNASRVASTYRIRQEIGVQKTKRRSKATLIELDRYLTLGEGLKKARDGILNTHLRVSYWLNLVVLNVLSAVLKRLHAVEVVVSSAKEDALLVGTHENIERESVYNLSVENEHEYYANGILVKNCTAYWRVGMERFGGMEGAVIGGEEFKLKESPVLNVQETMPAPDPKKLFRRIKKDDWRKRGI